MPSLKDFTFVDFFTEIIKMSQLVSSGDSIKIWDTSTYDCIYDWPSPGNTTGECSVVIVKLDQVSPGCHYTSNSWSCDQGCVASCTRERSASSRAVLTYFNKNSSCYSSSLLKLEGIENPTLLQFPRYQQTV